MDPRIWGDSRSLISISKGDPNSSNPPLENGSPRPDRYLTKPRKLFSVLQL
jgi:hypothetical protein